MIPSAFFVQSDANLGAVEIATFLGLVLFGISLAQGYTYFRRCEDDSRGLKILVGILLLMESFHSFTASHTIYYDTVTRWNRAEINSYSLSANAATETLVTVVVQCFFSHRIYRISKKKKPITILCFSLAILRLIFGLAVSAECVIDVHRTPNWVVFVTRFNWLITSTLAVGAAADVVIACSMLYYLRKLAAPGNMKSTAAVLNRLVRWSLQTGLITSMTSVTVIICFQAMKNLVWFGLYVILAKVYSNSLLASLNARPRKRRSFERRQPVSTNMMFDTVPAGAGPIGVTFQLTELSSGTMSTMPSMPTTTDDGDNFMISTKA
ncbi:hypothetical protein D9619_012807 [Psilocybe cf. subviscida]|uniref:DUF6534 domain-containing protein n=1 Tax=Psilocybe cf. subviscida TaxID=2480587 RepID=A0A8H5ER64_9AGAR|nr:hypothetical protein D9619_012807 [Psilocybe cf. subviscida]